MAWTITGMALLRSHSIAQLISHRDILLAGHPPFVAPGAVVQARQHPEEDVIRLIFEKTGQIGFEKTPLFHWDGLTLMAVKDTRWRIPVMPENDAAFA